jgi:RNA polymerase sigma-70 factor (ECF subfamily)
VQLSLARRSRLRAAYEMSLTERLFLARLRVRDERAFQELVAQFGDRVFNLVLRMVGDRAEAEDIAQEVFVTVWKSIESFRAEAKLSTWLLRIAANHAKNRIKYLARRATDKGGLDEAPESALADLGKAPAQSHFSSPEAALEAAERGDALERAISDLDEDQRLVLVLRDIEELSYDEICEITGLPEGTVKSRIHRARLALKERLEQDDREDSGTPGGMPR